MQRGHFRPSTLIASVEDMTHYDLIIIGAGSGNTFLSDEFSHLSIAIVQDGPFGGTCLNVGCIPTKMYAHTAEVARTPAEASKFGVHETLDSVDWPAIRDRIFTRIDQAALEGLAYRQTHPDNENVTVIKGRAKLTGPKTMDVETVEETLELSCDLLVIANGGRPSVPPIDGLDDVDFFTSDTVMRMDTLPDSLLVLGSGFVGAEFASIFAGLGVDVTLIGIEDCLLANEDDDVSARYTKIARAYLTVQTGFTSSGIEARDGKIVLTGDIPDGQCTLEADALLVATGRQPNTDLLGAESAGFDLHEDGRLAVDKYQRVLAGGKPVDGVWALGDISSPYQLKHIANHQAKIVKHNLLHDELREVDHRYIPHAVFGYPRIGSVGMTEAQAREEYDDVVVGKREYSTVAYGWALEDTTGFAKVIARESGELLGAHVIGPEAPTLVQLLIQAMSTGQKVQDIVRTQHWIHPALPEVIENALIDTGLVE